MIGAIWLSGYALATALVTGSHTGQLVLGDAAYHVPLVAAAAAAFIAGARLQGRMRWFWRLIGVSVALILIGELVLSFYEVVLGTAVPVPSIADPFYLLGSAAVIPAMFIGFAGASSNRRNRAYLDATIVMVGVGVVGWRLLIAPQLTTGFTLGAASQIAYPLLDIAVLVVLMSLGFGGHRKVPATIAIVGIAYAIAVLGDAAYSYLSIHGDFQSGGWIDLTWQLQFVLLAVAGVAAARHEPATAEVIAVDRDYGQVPVFVGAGLVLVLVGADLGQMHAVATFVAVAGTLAALLRRYQLTGRDLRELSQRLALLADEQTRLATTDDLTSLHNRRFIVDAARRALDDRRDRGGYVGLLEVDIDHFKSVNDLHGHDAGDVVLVEVARRLAACGRDDDLVARYGGEEFIVLVRISRPSDLADLAERWRAAVSAAPIALADGGVVTPTASVGGAYAVPGDSTLDELLLRADRALYQAKAAGRDRVVVCDEVRAA